MVAGDVPSALPRGTPVAVIGAGAMGAGIAQIAAVHGHPVRLHDVRADAADRAREGIRNALERLGAKGKLDRAALDAACARIACVDALEGCGDAGLVVEAIVEDLAAKRALFDALERIVATDCVLASNTSSLSITALAAERAHPGRVVGMHFFNPAPVLPLVEVVSGLATDRHVADMVHATAAAWGKTPVHAASTPGFIVNRCARPYYAEALRLLQERAADPATLDAIMREAGGFRMGPFELMDLVGHDVNFAVTSSVWEAYFHDPRYTPSVLQHELVVAGFLGRKRGRGFYRYGSDAPPVAPQAEARSAPPRAVVVHGDAGLLRRLLDRIADAGIAVDEAEAHPAFADVPLVRIDGAAARAHVALTDGRTATLRAVETGVRDLVLLDHALDFASATRFAVARADTCSDASLAAAVGALQAAGASVSRLDDVAGLAVLRTVAMLANEASDAATQGVAKPGAIDTAMRLGVNYPRGPFEWARAIGVGALRDALAHLARHYGEDRYRVSPLIARRALTGEPLDG